MPEYDDLPATKPVADLKKDNPVDVLIDETATQKVRYEAILQDPPKNNRDKEMIADDIAEHTEVVFERLPQTIQTKLLAKNENIVADLKHVNAMRRQVGRLLGVAL